MRVGLPETPTTRYRHSTCALYSETNVMLAGHPDTYNKRIDDTPINYLSPSFFPETRKKDLWHWNLT